MFPPYPLLPSAFKTPTCISPYVRNKNWPVFINFAILVHPPVFLALVSLFEIKHCLAKNSYLHSCASQSFRITSVWITRTCLPTGHYRHRPLPYSNLLLNPTISFPSSKPSYSTHLLSITIYYIIFPTSLFNFAIIYIKDKITISFACNRIRPESATLKISGLRKSAVEKVQIDTLPVT